MSFVAKERTHRHSTAETSFDDGQVVPPLMFETSRLDGIVPRCSPSDDFMHHIILTQMDKMTGASVCGQFPHKDPFFDERFNHI